MYMRGETANLTVMLMRSAAIFVIIFLLAGIGLTSGEVHARQRLNIGLTRFEAFPLDNAVRLEWDTETELGTAGYRLKRGQNGAFSFLQQPGSSDPVFINSEGGPSFGASYNFLDETAVNGETYSYQLVEVTIDGSETVQANQTVTAGLVPTNTPIILDGTGGGGGSQPTSTPLPSATITTTQVSSSTPIPTPTKVATIPPTVTPRATMTQISPVVESETVDNTNDVEIAPTTIFQPVGSPTETSGMAVAQALEEPSVAESLVPKETSFEENVQQALTIVDNAVKAVQEENPVPIANSNPIVIGGKQPIDNRTAPGSVEGHQETTIADNEMAGRIYLWVAFIAAFVIFTAAVLGAILLYTRRRNKE